MNVCIKCLNSRMRTQTKRCTPPLSVYKHFAVFSSIHEEILLFQFVYIDWLVCLLVFVSHHVWQDTHTKYTHTRTYIYCPRFFSFLCFNTSFLFLFFLFFFLVRQSKDINKHEINRFHTRNIPPSLIKQCYSRLK